MWVVFEAGSNSARDNIISDSAKPCIFRDFIYLYIISGIFVPRSRQHALSFFQWHFQVSAIISSSSLVIVSAACPLGFASTVLS